MIFFKMGIFQFQKCIFVPNKLLKMCFYFSNWCSKRTMRCEVFEATDNACWIDLVKSSLVICSRCILEISIHTLELCC